ncbi:hypothetical protein CDAR_490131 [Caerostris darwini]|uniref:Uncharacterized protein n=1 Tax=Caerostris darwini TaxID=1538125 RepID=A0AAV4TIU8_9ARAC|nr:hypothetical protein CDAR_490131 [Caerostris darwini]
MNASLNLQADAFLGRAQLFENGKSGSSLSRLFKKFRGDSEGSDHEPLTWLLDQNLKNYPPTPLLVPDSPPAGSNFQLATTIQIWSIPYEQEFQATKAQMFALCAQINSTT